MPAPEARDELIRSWLDGVLRQTGLKPTPLAKRAGLSPSTLLRFLDGEGSLDLSTIDKIVDTYGVPGPQLYGEGAAHAFAEPDLVVIETDGPALWQVQLKPTQGVWQLKTRVLELAGFLPGDLLVFDSAVKPEARDIVVAQVLSGGSPPEAETVLRLYDPPYLLTETTDPAMKRKPLLVDNDRVGIWGVFVKMLRTRNR